MPPKGGAIHPRSQDAGLSGSFTVIRTTIRLQWTPAELRGRMTAVQMVLAFGGPQLGEVESGLLAALMGVSFTIFTGGMVTLLIVGWVAWRYPELRNYIHKDG